MQPVMTVCRFTFHITVEWEPNKKHSDDIAKIIQNANEQT